MQATQVNNRKKMTKTDEVNFQLPFDPRNRQQVQKVQQNSIQIGKHHSVSSNGKKDEAKFKNDAETTFMNDLRSYVFKSKQEFETKFLAKMNALNARNDFYQWKVT